MMMMIMFMVLSSWHATSRVHPVHMMNMEWRQTTQAVIMDYRGGDFTAAGCPGGGRATALSLCVQSVGGA